MKRTYRRLLMAVTAVLLCAGMAVSCQNGETETDTHETVTGVDITAAETETTQTQEKQPDTEEVKHMLYTKSQLPDFGQYMNDKNIERALTGKGALAVALNAKKVWFNDGYTTGNGGMLTSENGVLSVNAAALGGVVGKTVSGNTVNEAAASLGMQAVVYENKMVLFYTGSEAPLDIFDDFYTCEALYLMLTEADSREIDNAFIDLPSLISNNKNAATYFTYPDISLAVQTNIYYQQLGDNDAVATGPAIVAGEGKNEQNHTLVRVLNRQQICTAQFLAYPVAVTGGVQVCAAQIADGDTVIATAAYSADINYLNIFDEVGTKRAVIYPDERIAAPYTILTGHFLPDNKQELLLVTGSATGGDGQVCMALYSLTDASLVKIFKMDYSFAAQNPMQLSVRENADGADTIIVYFTALNTAYEGSADTMQFEWTGIQLPENTAGVYASADSTQTYIASLKMTDNTKNQSFVRVYDAAASEWGTRIDVGFKENVFYSSKAADNDYAYVDKCSFQHIRADIANTARAQLAAAKTKEAFDNLALSLTYDDYAFSGVSGYQQTYLSENVMLEPCFTHHWNGGSFTGFVNYTDENGEHKYSAIGKSGEYVEYIELGSSFDNGTYADGLLVLAKMRIYPLRTFTRALAGTFRGVNGDTSKLIGISPVHEQEINVDGSVGDYNVNMVRGFASYLAAQYGSIENINKRFGTSFASLEELDAPRDAGRGDWDVLTASNNGSISEYGQMWTMYNRNVINKRIMEAYRETLLAGFAPETISSHQIPEGDAVSGFLGQADTRLSPVDVVMSCGTAFGATRYGSFYSNKNNFVNIAHKAGHNSIELGEYSSLYETQKEAYKQLSYLWKNGVRVNHIITFNDKQANAELLAVQQLAEENQPRPGYTTGTDNIVGVNQAGSRYNIIEIGQGEDEIGLLKSVRSDGTWEGTVYVVPFHAHVDVQTVEMKENGENSYISDKIVGMQNGDQVEFTFDAVYTGSGSAKVKVQVYHAGYVVDAAETEFVLTSELTNYRYVLSNQISPEALEVVFTFEAEDGTKLTVSDISAVYETESVGRKYFEGNKAYQSSVAHVGGITFDVLTRDMKN